MKRLAVKRRQDTDPDWVDPAHPGDLCTADVQATRTAIRSCDRLADVRVVWAGLPAMPMCREHFQQSGIELDA